MRLKNKILVKYGILFLTCIGIFLLIRLTYMGPMLFGYGRWEKSDESMIGKRYHFGEHAIGKSFFSQIPCYIIGGEIHEFVDDVPCGENKDAVCIYITKSCVPK